MKYWNILGFS